MSKGLWVYAIGRADHPQPRALGGSAVRQLRKHGIPDFAETRRALAADDRPPDAAISPDPVEDTPPSQLLGILRDVRVQADALLETQSVSAATVDRWEALAEEYAEQQIRLPLDRFLAFAVQGGREVRIYVAEDKVDDRGSIEMSAEIARRISAEMTFPGQIRVTVIREMRVVEYAR